GVCMLYASDDKEKPIPFLEFASNKSDVEKEVFFYLARAYHLNYRFDDAIKQYQAYQKVASAAKAEKLMVDRQIEMCKNGKKLLRNLTDLVVIDKKEMSRAEFYRSYDISDIGGKLLVKPDEESFKSALDKKKKEKSIIYLASNNNQVFFSSYGEDAEQGKDIYIIRKLPTGNWSKPQTLGYPVNTEFDEDYPFLHPNGKVLYFCSKGHNSMGGYDIYKTTLNEETNTWNKPVNLDFPINTPDDDILYVTNEDEKEAYFSSARASKSGKTAVYHINVERKPIDVAIIKGAVVKNRDNQPLDVKITIKDLNDNVMLGIFNSKPGNGVYLINIPNGGKFLFTVEATGFATQSDVVEVPVQYTFRPMKQEISYEIGIDKLIIKNLFDEVLDDASYLLALNFIKEKSKMEVSSNDNGQSNASSSTKDSTASSDLAIKTNTNTSKTTDNTGKTNPANNLSNADIVKIGYSDAADVAKEAKDLNEQADVALVLANQKNELAINKAKEAAQLLSDASKMDDNVKKQATIDEANEASKEAEDLNQETVAAFNLAKKIEFRAAAKEQEAELSLQYAKDLEAAVKSKTADAGLFARLDEQQKKLDALAEQNNNPTLANSLKMDVDNKKRELDKALLTTQDIKQEIADNEALIISTQADADKEKNANVKQGLLDQVAGLRMDTEDSKKDLAVVEQKVARLQKEYVGVVNETALVTNVYDQAKTVTSEKAAADVAMIDKTKLEQKVNEIKNTPVTSDNSIAVNNSGKDTNLKTNDSASDNTVKGNDNTAKTADNSIADNTAKTTDNSPKIIDNATNTNDKAIADNSSKTKDSIADYAS
ncbi:MAG: PD40 domain-containing protein, partial [Bacteroidetes bacterium]|nr:PD40 domain-containing protein [Bacteroidota bacterium]